MQKFKIKDDVESIKGYVYFIINITKNKLYVGETMNIDRIEKYQKVIDKRKSINRFPINKQLEFDMIDDENIFNIIYFETINYKKYERIYIHYLLKNYYDLYNNVLYKPKYKKEDIDMNLIESLKINPNGLKKTYWSLYDESVMNGLENIYLGEGLYLTSYGDIIEC